MLRNRKDSTFLIQVGAKTVVAYLSLIFQKNKIK